jgi:hypothetical protein
VEERLRKHLTITEVTLDETEAEEEEALALPEITPDMDKIINNAMASGGQVQPGRGANHFYTEPVPF